MSGESLNDVGSAVPRSDARHPYVVLVHGWGGSQQVWDGMPWPADWRVLRYELPGHGRRRDDGEFTIPLAVDDLAEFIARNVPAGQRALLVAHSMGGQLSLGVHVRYPQLVSGEVVIDPAYGADEDEDSLAWHRMMLQRFRDRPVEALTEFIQGAFSPYLPDAARSDVLHDAERTNPRAIGDFFESEYLAAGSFGMRTPALLMASKRVRPTMGFYLTRERAAFEQECGTRDVTVWTGGHGHFLFLEDPKRFCDEVAGWAQSVGLYVPTGNKIALAKA